MDYGTTVESYIIVRREQSIQSPVTTTDTNTNIKLESNTDIVPSDTVLEVKVVDKNNITVENANNFIAYDITLKSNGTEIQPNGNVKIKIPVPEGYKTNSLIVYRIDGNNKIKYNVTVETIDGVNYAVFETNHFSTYILAEQKTEVETKPSTDNQQQTTTPPATTETPSKPTTNKGEKDNTPKTGTIDIIGYMIPVAVISAYGIILIKRKETK